jgi:RNA polymerase sigma-70 factor (ECF subfamily)
VVAEAEKEQFFQEVVAANQRRILAIARSYAPAGERQDLCQEILLQMWKGLNGFQGRSTPSTWVYRVALNTALTFRRKNSRRPAMESVADSEVDGVAPADPGNAILVIEEFMRSLGKVDRAVFLLYLEDLSYREISEVTGLTENHVGVRVSRLKKIFIQQYCGG